MSAPTVLELPTRTRVVMVVLALLMLGLFLFFAITRGLSDETSLTALATVLLVGGSALWLLATSSPVLVLDDRGFHAPLLRRPETTPWGAVRAINSRTSPFGYGYLEVEAWNDPRDHAAGVRTPLQVPNLLLPVKQREVYEEMQRRRSTASAE